MSLVVCIDRSTEPIVKLLNHTCHGSFGYESVRTARQLVQLVGIWFGQTLWFR